MKEGSYVGCAVVEMHLHQIISTHKFRLPPDASVYRAELLALLQAVRLIISSGQMDRDHAIYTDSLSSLQSLQDPFCLDPTALDIHNLVHSNKLHILFAYVRGHQDTEGNNLADTAAKEAVTDLNSPELAWTTPPNLKIFARQRTQQLWQDQLSTETTASWTRRILPSNLKQCRDQLVNLRLSCNSRYDTVLMNRILSGHVPTNAYLHRFHLRNDPTCSSCRSAPETIEHLLYECNRYLPIKYAFSSTVLQPNETQIYSINNPRTTPLTLSILKHRFNNSRR